MIVDTFFHRVLRFPYKMHIALDKNKKVKPTIVFVHGLGSSGRMWQEITPKINSARVISVDLLGFGKSPKPQWMKYNARQQAISLHSTLIKQGVYGNVILVGHSLGALVAIEYARKYSFSTMHLILCSPPLYIPGEEKFQIDNLYIKLYKLIRSQPDTILKGSRYIRANKGMMIDEQTLPAYIKSLESGIENQNSYKHLSKLKTPTDIMYGQFDILLITKNLKTLTKQNKNIKLHSVSAGHEVVGLYKTKLISLIYSVLHIEN